MASEGMRRMDDEVRRRQREGGEHKDALSALKASTAKHNALQKKLRVKNGDSSADEARLQMSKSTKRGSTRFGGKGHF